MYPHLLSHCRRVVTLEAETEPLDPGEHVIDHLASPVLRDSALDDTEAITDEVVTKVAIDCIACK